MPAKKPNSWAVMYRDPKDTKWKIDTWYPAINITHTNGAELTPETSFDIGEIRASHQASMILLKHEHFYEVTTRYVYNKVFDKDNGRVWTYTGEQE